MNWTVFWEFAFFMFVIMPLLFIWGFAIVDLFTRHDLGGFSKMLWLFGIIFFPLIGTVVYYLFRPMMVATSDMEAANAYASGAYSPAPTPPSGQEMSELTDLRNKGVLSQEEFDRGRQRLQPT